MAPTPYQIPEEDNHTNRTQSLAERLFKWPFSIRVKAIKDVNTNRHLQGTACAYLVNHGQLILTVW